MRKLIYQINITFPENNVFVIMPMSASIREMRRIGFFGERHRHNRLPEADHMIHYEMQYTSCPSRRVEMTSNQSTAWRRLSRQPAHIIVVKCLRGEAKMSARRGVPK